MKRSLVFLTLALCGVSLFAGSFISVTNAGFESGAGSATQIACIGTCIYTTGVGVPSWAVQGVARGAGVFAPGDQFSTYLNAMAGSWVAYANSSSVGAGANSLTNTTGTAVVPGQMYAFSVDIANGKNSVWDQTLFNAGFAPYIALQVGGVTVSTVTLLFPQAAPQGNWLVSLSGNWTAPLSASGDLGIQLGVGASTQLLGAQAYFDNVYLWETPEPTALLLVGAGLFGICLLRRSVPVQLEMEKAFHR